MELTQERVRELLTQRDDGQLVWNVKNGRGKAGEIAGTPRKDGFLGISVDGVPTLLHRVVFLMQHGWVPKLVDHINGDRSDNRPENLRARVRVKPSELTQQQACELLEYRDGLLYWRKKMSNKQAGSLAGCHGGNGYWLVRVNRKNYGMHRIIFLMFHGYMPRYVDHADMNRGNNRIENLRAATNGQNMSNRGAQANNSSGYKGVNWSAKSRKWIAKITVNRKQMYLGSFDTAEDAAIYYAVNAFRYHGEFAKL